MRKIISGKIVHIVLVCHKLNYPKATKNPPRSKKGHSPHLRGQRCRRSNWTLGSSDYGLGRTGLGGLGGVGVVGGARRRMRRGRRRSLPRATSRSWRLGVRGVGKMVRKLAAIPKSLYRPGVRDRSLPRTIPPA